MRIYAITDELSEEVVNVFLAKNDKVAINKLKLDLNKFGAQVEVKLHALDIEIIYDDKFYAFYDDNQDKEYRTIFSFPQDVVEKPDELKKEIVNDSIQEEK